jgi:hypothetical protein
MGQFVPRAVRSYHPTILTLRSFSGMRLTLCAAPDKGSDTTLVVRQALSQCRMPGPHRLVFSRGRDDF